LYPQKQKVLLIKNEMAHKGKYFKVILKDIATMTVGTDPKEIWRAGRKKKTDMGCVLKDLPSKNGFLKAWSCPINYHRATGRTLQRCNKNQKITGRTR
jgi:hypothetical protein